MTKEEYKELLEETSGKFGGIGLEITLRNGALTVVTPLPNTPAWQSGVKPNDKIIKIDQKSTKDLTLNDTVKLLRGEPLSKVKPSSE
jgi:carboxyl-terminal processing protease